MKEKYLIRKMLKRRKMLKKIEKNTASSAFVIYMPNRDCAVVIFV